MTEAVATNLRQEILAAHSSGLLTLSGNVLAVRTPDGQRAGVAQEKPNVFEADIIAGGLVERPDVLRSCPVLAKLLEEEGELRALLNDARPELRLDRLEQAKIQVNTGGGGAFPLHFDVPSSKSSRRVLTALLYLNPAWEEGDGGEVELLPFPFPDLVVAPVDRRLVVFSSNTTMHRVRPFTGAEGRACINLWFEGDSSSPFPAPLPAEDYDARAARVIRVLRNQPNELRAFCKVWYRDAIAASFKDAFSPSEELDAAVRLHFEEAKEVESRIAPATLDLLRECVPFERLVEEAGELGGLFDGL